MWLGDGFFIAPERRHERGGSFKLASDGRLITEQGFEVLGDGGPVTLPRDNKSSTQRAITADGDQLGTWTSSPSPTPKPWRGGAEPVQIRKGSRATEGSAHGCSVQQGRPKKRMWRLWASWWYDGGPTRLWGYQKMMTADTITLVINKVGQIS
jgi:flagellar basal-body rod protein FlgG